MTKESDHIVVELLNPGDVIILQTREVYSLRVALEDLDVEHKKATKELRQLKGHIADITGALGVNLGMHPGNLPAVIRDKLRSK